MANEGYTSCKGLISATLPAEIFFLVFKAVDALLYPCIRLLIHSKACLQVKATLSNITVRCASEVGGLIETGSIRNDNMTSSSLSPIPQTYSANNLSVDELAATYFIAFTMLLYTPAVFLGCFCGAWSDTVGRKLPALAGCTGIVLTIVVYLLSIAVDSGPLTTLTLILIGAGIQGSFGDSAMVSMAIYSYVSDLTTSESRTRVLGRLLGMNFFGCVLGLVLIGALLDTAGFSVTLYVALLLMCTCWFICATFMQG
jgi:MFS family permease